MVVTIHHPQRNLESRSHTYCEILSLLCSQREHVISGHVYSLKHMKMVCILRILFLLKFLNEFIPKLWFKMHFVAVSALFFLHGHRSPGDDWRPQLTNQLPSASLCSGCSKPSDDSRHVIIIAKQQLARTDPDQVKQMVFQKFYRKWSLCRPSRLPEENKNKKAMLLKIIIMTVVFIVNISTNKKVRILLYRASIKVILADFVGLQYLLTIDTYPSFSWLWIWFSYEDTNTHETNWRKMKTIIS